jgi:phosphoserine phosphatase RsbU/P
MSIDQKPIAKPVSVQAHPGFDVWFRRCAAAVSIIIVAMAGLGLLGWGHVKTSTGLGFLPAGLSLWFLRREPGDLTPWQAQLGRGCAWLSVVLGVFGISQYLLGRYIGLDRLFLPVAPGASSGPMTPIAGLNFVLAGAALLALNVEIRGRFWPAQFLAIATMVIGLIGTLGRLYGAKSLTGPELQTRMSLHTAVGFVVLAVGVLCARPDRGILAIFNSDSAGGEMARRLLPAAVLIPTGLGALRMWARREGLLPDMETEVALLMVATMVVFGVFIWVNAHWLYRGDMKRKRVEEAFAQERYLMNMLMDNIPDHIYFKDRESRFLRVNKAMAKLFNLPSPAMAVGKMDSDFFTSEHAQQARADEQRIMQTGQALHGQEEKETWPDGSITWVSSTKGCLRDEQGRVIGTFGISRDITARKLAEENLVKQATELRRKNEQIEEEMKMASELQLALLPQEFPSVPRSALPWESALRFFSFYHATGSVSGDYFDVFPLSDSMVGMFICDVMGHGVRAALVTAMMHAFVQDFNSLAGDPGRLLSEVNRGLTGIFKEAGTMMYTTAFYLVADVGRGRLLYANAGHPSPLQLHRPTGEVDTLRHNGKTGPALGLFSDAAYKTFERPMAAGDLLLLFTDGLFEVEGRNDEQYTQDRLLAAVRSRVNLDSAELVDSVLAEVKEFSVRHEFDDDVCLIGAEVERLIPSGNGE